MNATPYTGARLADRPYTILNAIDRKRDIRRRRLEGAAIAVAAVALGLLIAKAAVNAADAPPPTAPQAAASVDDDGECWQQLPMRKAITQAHINRLCVKPLPRKSAPLNATTTR